MRAGAGHGAARYETASATHHHFVCIHCGKISDVPASGAPDVSATAAGVDGRIEHVQITYRGVCSDCLSDR